MVPEVLPIIVELGMLSRFSVCTGAWRPAEQNDQ
jgi:hypothetical protein